MGKDAPKKRPFRLRILVGGTARPPVDTWSPLTSSAGKKWLTEDPGRGEPGGLTISKYGTFHTGIKCQRPPSMPVPGALGTLSRVILTQPPRQAYRLHLRQGDGVSGRTGTLALHTVHVICDSSGCLKVFFNPAHTPVVTPFLPWMESDLRDQGGKSTFPEGSYSSPRSGMFLERTGAAQSLTGIEPSGQQSSGLGGFLPGAALTPGATDRLASRGLRTCSPEPTPPLFSGCSEVTAVGPHLQGLLGNGRRHH